MLVALAVLAAIETAAPPVVELSLSGSNSAPVSAAPRSLSDFAKERRAGRRAVGGFTAVETTVTSGPWTLPPFEWIEEEEERLPEPEVVPQPPAEWVVPYVQGWGGGYGGGGWRGAPPHRRPPHVSHHARPRAHPARRPEAGPSPRPGAPQINGRSAVRPFQFRVGQQLEMPGQPGRRR